MDGNSFLLGSHRRLTCVSACFRLFTGAVSLSGVEGLPTKMTGGREKLNVNRELG